MKLRACLLVAAHLVAVGLYLHASRPISKEKAIAQIESCLHRWDSSNRACAGLNANIDVLIGAYRIGDKSVLPEILKFSYLTNFFDEALLSNTDGFLSAIYRLPTDRQNAIAKGTAGEQFQTLPKARFLAIKAALEGIPQNSPNRALADMFLKALQEHNASLFVDYFPPDTFTAPVADFRADWYSRVLYGLGEAPLWRISSDAEETWRFTYIGAWGGRRTAMLTVHNIGTGSVRLKWEDSSDAANLRETESAELTAEQVDRFLDKQRQANFWDAPTQIPSGGFDGAEWLLEGVKSGHYHLVTRWCPATASNAETLAFADACRLLLEFAGHPYTGDC